MSPLKMSWLASQRCIYFDTSSHHNLEFHAVWNYVSLRQFSHDLLPRTRHFASKVHCMPAKRKWRHPKLLSLFWNSFHFMKIMIVQCMVRKTFSVVTDIRDCMIFCFINLCYCASQFNYINANFEVKKLSNWGSLFNASFYLQSRNHTLACLMLKWLLLTA